MKYTVTVLTRAQAQIQSIYDWLRDRSPRGADDWLRRLDAALESLERHPGRHAMASENDLIDRGIREILFKTRQRRSYRALSTIVGDQVRVLHVRGPGQPLVDPRDL